MVGTIKQLEDGNFTIEYLKRREGIIKILFIPVKPSQHEVILEEELFEQKVSFKIIKIKLNEFAQITIPERLYKLHEINQYTEYIKKHGIISFIEFTKI